MGNVKFDCLERRGACEDVFGRHEYCIRNASDAVNKMIREVMGR